VPTQIASDLEGLRRRPFSKNQKESAEEQALRVKAEVVS
jgi:hypothetical protein